MGPMAEVDFSWVNLDEPWQRLRWARSRKYDSASAFATAIGMKVGTYINHEREPGMSRNTALTAEKAMTFAKRLKVRWEWLFDGSGEPWLTDPDETPRARILRAIDGKDPDEQERIAAAIEAFAGRSGTRG